MQAMLPPLRACRGAGRVVLAENAHPSRHQPIRRLFGTGVAVATGDSSLLLGHAMSPGCL